MTFEQLKERFPSATPETWHRHINGGGWVANTATVEDTAYVGENALVVGLARVRDNAQVFGAAKVSGNAQVLGDAKVYGSAEVHGYARVLNVAQVYENADVSGAALVFGNAHVHGDAVVRGDAHVYCTARVSGNARLSGECHVTGGTWTCSPVQIQGSRHFVNEASDTLIRIGCLYRPPEWWAEHRVDEGLAENYTEAQLEEYRLILEFIATIRRVRSMDVLERAVNEMMAEESVNASHVDS